MVESCTEELLNELVITNISAYLYYNILEPVLKFSMYFGGINYIYQYILSHGYENNITSLKYLPLAE